MNYHLKSVHETKMVYLQFLQALGVQFARSIMKCQLLFKGGQGKLRRVHSVLEVC